MILHNAVLAGERQSLERRPPQLEVVPQQPLPSAPPMTLAAVCEWLERQSPETRATVARVLASDLTALQAAAQAEGFEVGKAYAIRELTERASSSLSALGRMASAAENAFALEATQLADSCADIVTEVFLKLAGPLLSTREAALGAVLAVLQRVKDEREVTIRVSEVDLPLLRTHEGTLREILGSRAWTLTADSRVSAGGCLVESSIGTLDGRLEAQLGKLCETLRVAKAARTEGM